MQEKVLLKKNNKVHVLTYDTGQQIDKYYDESGTVIRDEDFSYWDGRDHLGQIVDPGTYLIHIEATNSLAQERVL